MVKKYTVILDNGVEIECTDNPNSTTGLMNSSYSPNSNGGEDRPFLAYLNERSKVSAISSRGVLGFFKDPREAAYMVAYFLAHPDAVIKQFEQLKQQNPKGFRTAVYQGALAPKFPADLYTKIPFDEREVKEIAASKGTPAGSSKTKSRTVSTANKAWKEYRSSLGITHGSQLLSVLPGGNTPANTTFLGKLAQMPAEDAIAALASKGVNLDDANVLAKVTGAPVVKESLSESQQQLDRIKQLIKY